MEDVGTGEDATFKPRLLSDFFASTVTPRKAPILLIRGLCVE